jgi:hypothetical protein
LAPDALSKEKFFTSHVDATGLVPGLVQEFYDIIIWINHVEILVSLA